MADFSLVSALQQKILPAISFSDAESVLPVTEAILKGGLRVMEIPCRTAISMEAISLVRKNFPEMQVGAGTILSREQLKEAISAGAMFGLSPGFNPAICTAAIENAFPFIPGVMTPSEIEAALELGFGIQKLFPAEQLGGVGFLKAMLGPYAQLPVQFIPMGGVNQSNLPDYLALKNVIAVGGTWLATAKLIGAREYTQIEENVRKALTQN